MSEEVLYAAIASWKNKEILAQAGALTAKRVVADVIIPKLESDRTQGIPGCCSKYDDTKIYYTAFPKGYSVIQMCTQGYATTHSLEFNKTIAKLFDETGYPADQKCEKFESVLDSKIREFTDHPPQNKFDAVKAKQEQVKQVIIEDIEEAVKRHGQIEHVLEATDDLRDESQRFQSASKQVKRTAQCQLYKTYAMIAGVIIIVLAVLIIIICVAVGC